MAGIVDSSSDVIPRTVPKKALILSLSALAVAIASGPTAAGIAGDEHALLVSLFALVPAYLLAYYLGLRGAGLALVAGTVALLISQALLPVFGLVPPDWRWLLLVIVNFLAVAIGIGVLAELLHRERRNAEAMALADQLTGLPNRRHVEFALGREFGAAMRGRKLGVVMYDIDHFKQFNDLYGHAVGDEVLRTFGSVLRQYTRRQNISGRYGGEEFICVVSDVDREGILIFANRVREAIKNKELPWGRVSVSGGVALYCSGMGSHEVLVAAADRALYAAKDAGRDRVEVATDEAWVPGRPSAPRVSAPQQRRRVLVVDGEPEVRRTITALLEQEGYLTQDTGSAQEAARLMQDSEEPFDVVITSLNMPRSSGFTLVDKLTTNVPDLRVIYMSESMRERVSWPGVPGIVHRFVPKPVNGSVLLKTLKEALEQEVSS